MWCAAFASAEVLSSGLCGKPSGLCLELTAPPLSLGFLKFFPFPSFYLKKYYNIMTVIFVFSSLGLFIWYLHNFN